MNRTTITIAALLGLTALTGCNAVEVIDYVDQITPAAPAEVSLNDVVLLVDDPIVVVDCIPPAGSTNRPSAGATKECPSNQPASIPVDPCSDQDGRAGCDIP